MAIKISGVPQMNGMSNFLDFLSRELHAKEQAKRAAKQAADDKYYKAHSDWREQKFIAERNNPIFNPDKEAAIDSLAPKATFSNTFGAKPNPAQFQNKQPQNLLEFLEAASASNPSLVKPEQAEEAPKKTQGLIERFLDGKKKELDEEQMAAMKQGLMGKMDDISRFGQSQQALNEKWKNDGVDKSKWTPDWQITNDLTKEDIRRKYEEGDDKLRFRKPDEPIDEEMRNADIEVKKAQAYSLRNPRSSGGSRNTDDLRVWQTGQNNIRALHIKLASLPPDSEEADALREQIAAIWDDIYPIGIANGWAKEKSSQSEPQIHFGNDIWKNFLNNGIQPTQTPEQPPQQKQLVGMANTNPTKPIGSSNAQKLDNAPIGYIAQDKDGRVWVKTINGWQKKQG